jgi:hypothetical protein
MLLTSVGGVKRPPSFFRPERTEAFVNRFVTMGPGTKWSEHLGLAHAKENGMPAEFTPKPLPYDERLLKAQRILKAATFRYDQKLAMRELCEAIAEITTALIEREQTEKWTGQAPPPGVAGKPGQEGA